MDRIKPEELENTGKKAKGSHRLAVSAAIIAAAAVVMLCAYFALRERDSLKLDGSVSTCINGETMTWEQGVRLVRQGDETLLKADGASQKLESFPLIKEDGSIVLQRTCSWNRTEDNGIYRADYFTQLTEENGKIVMSRRGKRVEASDGFLYDNRDTYIFLEPATLYIGGEDGEKQNLSPMTVVQVSSNLYYFQIFGPDREPVFVENPGTDEIVAVFDSKKRINLAIDHYYMENGAWRLLFITLDALKGIETGG